MRQIEQRLDAIILSLKHTAALRPMRFVREYASEAVETPLRGWLAAVCVTRTVRERSFLGGFLTSGVKGEQYRVTAEIRVYAPAEANGTGLSEMTGALLAALNRADREQVIRSAAASSIEFDPELNAVFRRVELELAFCAVEEGAHGGCV